LRVNGELWAPQLWQSGVLSLQDCEPGLYHLEYSGDDPRLRLRQPLAGLVPLLVDGPFRLQDDPAGYNFEGGTSLDVEWNRVRARLECAHDRRAAFLLPPPSHLQLAVDTRAGDRLRYAFGAHDPNLLDASGMTRPPDQWPRRPVTFKVLWQIDPAAEPVVLDEVVWPHEKPSWLEREVVFSPEIAGDGVLTFTTDSEAHASGIVAAAVADPRIVRANPEGSPQVNLLLYCIDTLRADHLSCYGRENLTSPHLDQLAADGYLFENYYAVASWTRPSIASALTGLYPSYHGAAGEDRALSLESRTLAENLERVHYSNWAMVSNHQVAARGLSFEQGFHRFVAPEGLWATDEDLNLPSSLRLSETIFPWWDRYADEPFFLYSHSLDPHGPYHPPDGYFDRFTEGYDGPLRSIKLLAPRKELRRRSEHIQPEDVRYVRNVYDGAVTYQDEQIGRLLEQLDRHGLRDDTILVIFSDHGEEFFEHGDWDHAGRMWEELLRVPLILWIPERLRADLKSPPLRVSAPVSQVDLVPSLLELLGIPDESPRQGRSFLPILREAEVDERPIYCEENIRGSLIHGGYKLIWLRSRTTTEYQLFDLKADPGEQDDLRERRPDLLQEMVIRRNQFEEEMEAVGVDAATGAATVDLDAEARRQLKALGYFDH
jgi:arylsulfatase A-like enzyme